MRTDNVSAEYSQLARKIHTPSVLRHPVQDEATSRCIHTGEFDTRSREHPLANPAFEGCCFILFVIFKNYTSYTLRQEDSRLATSVPKGNPRLVRPI